MLEYTPTEGEEGMSEYFFTYHAADVHGALSEEFATVTLSVENDSPNVNDDAFEVLVDTPTVLAVLANDTDPDGDSLRDFSVEFEGELEDGPFNGTIELLLNEEADVYEVIYTPNAEYLGEDSFRYTVEDEFGKRTGEAATVSITVVEELTVEDEDIVAYTAPNIAPNVVDDSASLTLGNSVLVNVLSNDSDSDGSLDSSTLEVVDAPSKGTASLESGQIRYAADRGMTGQDTFTYRVKDNEGLFSGLATVTVTISPAPSSGGGGGGGGGGFIPTLPDPEIDLTEEMPVCDFSDLAEGDDYYDAIMHLCENWIVQGYEDGEVKPQNEINRAELLKIIVEGMNITPDEEQYRDCFPDVASDWYAKYVCYAKDMGWVEGYMSGEDTGYFRPERTLNRVETIKIILEAYNIELTEVTEDTFVDAPMTEWYAAYVQTAKDLGLFDDMVSDEFKPGEQVTRGESFNMLYKLLLVLEESPAEDMAEDEEMEAAEDTVEAGDETPAEEGAEL